MNSSINDKQILTIRLERPAYRVQTDPLNFLKTIICREQAIRNGPLSKISPDGILLSMAGTVINQVYIEGIYNALTLLWPDRQPQLSYTCCFELLVAVMLSAQCTDEQVNKVTPTLFASFPDMQSMARADKTQLENLIRSTGFYHTKAANIIAASRMLIESFDGKIPESIEELVRLPGVGRKTANLVVSACFNKPGIVVDTHVLRLARRLGIAPTEDATKSERMIAALIEPERWTAFSHALNRHGKYICIARKPKCPECVLNASCPAANLGQLPSGQSES